MFEDGGDGSHELDCAGKQKFSSPQLARDIARRRALNGKKGDAYRCPDCDQWHIGRKYKWIRVEKTPKRKRKR